MTTEALTASEASPFKAGAHVSVVSPREARAIGANYPSEARGRRQASHVVPAEGGYGMRVLKYVHVQKTIAMQTKLVYIIVLLKNQ